MNQRAFLPVFAATCCFFLNPAHASHHVAHEVKLAGNGGWDYLAVDSKGGKLFVSHGTQVDVLDMGKLASIGSIADTPGVHGIAIAPDLGRGYVSAGAAASVVVFDLKSLARIGEIKTTGENPDAILYEPHTHRVLTFNGRGHNVTAIDARQNTVVGTIALDAKPEFAVVDDAGHVFVNLEDKNSIAELDPQALTVKAIWHLAACEEPSGLAIDRAHHRLFSVCSNKIMEVVDATNGHSIAQLPIGDGVDGAAFDPGAQLAFASGGDGTLTIVKEETPDKYSVSETVRTKAGARTLTLDEKTHRIYLSTAQRAPAPAPVAGQPRQRPAIVPDTFEVLVIEP
jgi:DNA-binding beta-propeller fold protein YncE